MAKQEIENIVAIIEDELGKIYPDTGDLIAKTSFIEALNYTLLAGGKRIRPLLALVFCEICAIQSKQEFNRNDCMPLALALEMVHTYSLIHDDLPSMDNDDLRRGKPTCHKKYDEATAILTGDALLSDAFSMLTKLKFEAKYVIQVIDLFSKCIGSQGMVAGQILDMAMEEKNTSFFADKKLDIKDALSIMNARKTGDLLLASCCLPPLLYNSDKKFYSECELFAKHFGLAFQISDDILDVVGDTKLMGKPQGSDIAANKSTWVTLLGLDGARQEVAMHVEGAEKIVHTWALSPHESKLAYEILQSLLQSLKNRLK